MSARRRRVLLDIGGNPAEARRAVREVREELRRLAREDVEARVDLNERVVLAKIERVKQRLERLSKQEASPEVDVKVAGAYAQLDRLNLRLDRLRLKRVNIDVDVRRGVLERTASGLGTVERGVQGVGRGFANVFRQVPVFGGLMESVLGGLFSLASGLGEALASVVTRGLSNITALAGPIGSVAGSAVSLGLSFASLAAVGGALIIALNAILGAIIALAGALVALVASAAAATLGLGALAVALGAVLIPIAIVGFGVFQRFQAILKAHQAQEQQLAQAVQAQKTAEQQRKDALDSSKRAHEQLAQATVEGNRAMEQSALDLRDAELGLDSAKLSVREDKLGLQQARKDLREFLRDAGASGPALSSLVKRFSDVEFNPAGARSIFAEATGGGKADPLELQRRILAVQRAQLTYKEALNQTEHAEDTLSQAQAKRTDFLHRGLRAYQPYRAALEATRRSDERLKRAQDATSAAQRKYQQALKDLSGTERGTLDRVNGLVEGFKRLAKAFTDPIFRALNGVFDSLKGKGGQFRDVLVKLGEAFGDVVRAIGSFLTEPATLSAFQTMARGAASLVRELGARAFTSFLRIMREIAVAALPAVRHAAHDVANALGRIAGQPGRIHSAVHGVIGQFRTWARLAGSVVGLVKDIFGIAAPQGRSLATSLRHIVDRWREWIRANPDKVRKFFRDAVARAREIVHWLIHAAHWLRDNLPAAAAKAKHAFEDIYSVVKVISKAIDGWKDIKELVAPGTNKLDSAARSIRTDITIANREAALLQKHLTLQQRQQSRQRLADALKDIQDQGGSLSGPFKKLLKRLQALGFQGGGPVPGSGRGDVVPAMLEPGEFVLRRAVVQQLSLPVLRALNGGSVPQLQPAAVGAGGNVFLEQHVVTTDPDPRHYAAKLASEMGKAVSREVQRAGLVSP